MPDATVLYEQYKANYADQQWRDARFNQDTPWNALEMVWSRYFIQSPVVYKKQLHDAATGKMVKGTISSEPTDNELRCYAKAVWDLKNTDNTWWDINDGLKAKADIFTQSPWPEELYDNPLFFIFVLSDDIDGNRTRDQRGFYLKGGPADKRTSPSEARKYEAFGGAQPGYDGAEARSSAAAGSQWGWIKGHNNIFIKEAHPAYQAHYTFQSRLKQKLIFMVEEWDKAGRPSSYRPMNKDEELYARALDVILDTNVPGRAKENGTGPQFPLFKYFHRTDGSESYTSCWGWLLWCNEIPGDQSSSFTIWNKEFLRKWIDFWNAIQKGTAADEMKIISREKFIEKVIKEVNRVVKKIDHDGVGKSSIRENILKEPKRWPRQSDVNGAWWAQKRHDGHWDYFGRNMKNSELRAKLKNIPKDNLSGRQRFWNSAAAYWGHPAKAIQYWQRDKIEWDLFAKDSPTAVKNSVWDHNWHLEKENWKTEDPLQEPASEAKRSGGAALFDFSKAVSRATKLKTDYKIYDTLPGIHWGANEGWDFPQMYTKDYKGIFVPMIFKDIEKMLTEFYKRNPGVPIYGTDKDQKGHRIAKDYDTAIGMVNMLYYKLIFHYAHNKEQWNENFFDPKTDRNIDATRFNFKDMSTYGQVINEAYDNGFFKFHQMYDAYYFKVAEWDHNHFYSHNMEKEYKRALTLQINWDFDADAKYGKRLMRDGDTYSRHTHFFDVNDGSQLADFKIAIEDMFVKYCAHACVAFYLGHAKMEAQEAFIMEVLKLESMKNPPLDAEALKNAEADAAADLMDSGLTSQSPTPDTAGLTDEEIEARQKFFKQCALMLNMEQFVQSHRFRINRDIADDVNGSIHNRGNGPYDGRFWMLEDSGNSKNKTPDQTSVVNKLFINDDLFAFLNIPQAVISMLVPKLRLYQVYSTKQSKNQVGLVETEFEFPQEGLGHDFDPNTLHHKNPRFANISAADRIDQMFNEEFDKGGGCGIKNFSFTYEGTNPATARNDISCELSLYFQSFNDFFRKRVNSVNNRVYQFVDLVLYPDNRKRQGGRVQLRKDKKDATNLKGPKEDYDPSDYRIRADVGWIIPHESSKNTIDLIGRQQGLGEDYYEKLVKILKHSNKSFYLNMVDHKMDVKDNGAVQLDINYRAYVETAMKTNRFNALLDSETYEMKQTQKQALADARAANCTRQDLMKLRREIDRQNIEITKNAHQSIMRRLIKRGKIYFVDVADKDKAEFERRGYFPNRPQFVDYTKTSKTGLASYDPNTKKRLKKALKSNNIVEKSFQLLNDDWVDENVSKNVRVNYFFMGDLIYTILDVVADLEPDLEKTKLLLCSFEYVDFDGRTRIANIADIPVSCDYFFEWYTHHVIKQKKMSFPIAYFIRTLCNHFITELLSDRCRNKSQVLKTRFTSGTFMAAPIQDRDPFWWMTASSSTTASSAHGLSRVMVQVGKYYGENREFGTGENNTQAVQLPLTHHDVTPGSNMSESFFQYMLIYPIVSPAMNHPGQGDEFTDRARGVHHIHIGARTGIIKKVSFERTDIQYIRESRFLNQGDDGLLQLGAVYKATIDMLGNTLWFPGMELYINPLGIGGLELGFPGDSKSAANKLGLGGYHLITRIKSTIAPGKFDTQIQAQFFYSGDGSIDKQRLGFVKQEDDSESVVNKKSELSNQECQTIMDGLKAGTLNLGVKYQRVDEQGSYSQKRQAHKTNMNKIAEQSPTTTRVVPTWQDKEDAHKLDDYDLAAGEGSGLDLMP